MLLFAGLGNPGPQYAKQRHNVGFMVIDAIAGHHNFPPWRKKYQGEFSEGMLGTERAFLLKPQTFMNRSGQSVAELARFYKIPPQQIFVFHDELDLAPGKVRVKLDGGTAGHNGLRSIDQCLGTKAFKRIRIGIGHPGHKDKVTGHVLGDFAKSDADWLANLIDAMAKHAGKLASGQDSDFMSQTAMAIAPPKPAKAAKPQPPQP